MLFSLNESSPPSIATRPIDHHPSFTTSTTVDSTPTSVAPPSSTASIRPSKSASTCAAVVGLVCPKRSRSAPPPAPPPAESTPAPPDAAASAPPPTRRPAVTASGHRSRARQQQRQRPRPERLHQRGYPSANLVIPHTSHLRHISRPSTCTISGSHPGRSFAANIFATASASSAFAPSPYTVSVGNATVPPARSNSAARATSCRNLRPQSSPSLTHAHKRNLPQHPHPILPSPPLYSSHAERRDRTQVPHRRPRPASSPVSPASASSSRHPAPSSRTPSTTRPTAASASSNKSSASASTARLDRHPQAPSHPAADTRFDPAPRYKVRIETETQVDDGPALGLPLRAARLHPGLPLRKIPHRVVAHPVAHRARHRRRRVAALRRRP